MTWRSSIPRARKARTELPAVARPLEGVAAASQPAFPPKLTAGVAPAAPAAILRKGKRGRPKHEPPVAEIRVLVNAGKSDPEIGRQYGHSKAWAQKLRDRYGIKPAFGPRGLLRSRWSGQWPMVKAVAPPTQPEPPAPPPAPQPVALSYADYFAEHGPYPSFTDSQIARYERRWALAHPKRAPAVIDVAPILYGDPKPGRAA